MTGEAVTAWKVPRGLDLSLIAEVANGGLMEPDLRVAIVSTDADTITAQIVEGSAPDDPTELLYLAGHGAYGVVRRFWWPEVAGNALLLTLRRRPSPTALQQGTGPDPPSGTR